MIFKDLRMLKTQPNGRDFCVADYNQDRISFYMDNPKKDFVALVSSSHVLAFLLCSDNNIIF